MWNGASQAWSLNLTSLLTTQPAYIYLAYQKRHLQWRVNYDHSNCYVKYNENNRSCNYKTQDKAQWWPKMSPVHHVKNSTICYGKHKSGIVTYLPVDTMIKSLTDGWWNLCMESPPCSGAWRGHGSEALSCSLLCSCERRMAPPVSTPIVPDLMRGSK